MLENTKVSTYDKMSLKEISDSLKNETDIVSKNEEENLKFYRYFELKGEFDKEPDYNFEDLINGKLSLVNASLMNDRLDSTLNINFAETKKELVEYYKSHKKQVFCMHLENMKFNFLNLAMYTNVSEWQAGCEENIMDLLYNDIASIKENQNALKYSGEAEERLKKLIIKLVNSDKVIEHILKTMIQKFDRYDFEVGKNADYIINAYRDTRNKRFLRSLAKSYKNDAMWAYYANNRGICVGYNLTKLVKQKQNCDEFSLESVILRKVNYMDEKPKFPAVEFFDSIVNFKHSPDNLEKINESYLEQITTKNKSWEDENEWRLIYSDDGMKKDAAYSFDLDLVDAVYIDESILDNNKVKRLLQVAKERGWTVHKRVLLTDRNAYDYPVLNEEDY